MTGYLKIWLGATDSWAILWCPFPECFRFDFGLWSPWLSRLTWEMGVEALDCAASPDGIKAKGMLVLGIWFGSGTWRTFIMHELLALNFGAGR